MKRFFAVTTVLAIFIVTFFLIRTTAQLFSEKFPVYATILFFAGIATGYFSYKFK